jgi:hypothetical protein
MDHQLRRVLRIEIAPAPPPKHYTPEEQERRMRSVRKFHMPSLYERPRHPAPKDTCAYIPACAARLENDPNLTDGARRSARKIMEKTHRQDRKDRKLQVSVSYLARGLRRCRRTVQRYLDAGARRVSASRGHVRSQVPHVHRADHSSSPAAVSAPRTQVMGRKTRKS